MPRIEKSALAIGVPAKSVVKAEERRARTAQWHVDLVGAIGICAATGLECRTEAHHLKTGEGVTRGTSYKSAGKWTVPLDPRVHRRVTALGGEDQKLGLLYALNWYDLAKALATASPDLERMRDITRKYAWEARLKRASRAD